MRIGFTEFLIIVVVVVLFLVPKQLPKLTSAVKDAISSFKSGVNDTEVVESNEKEADKE